MNKVAIVVAGGTGTRAGAGVPKQFRSLLGRPVFWYSLKAFREEDSQVRLIMVVHKDWMEEAKEMVSGLPQGEQIEFEIVEGGTSRLESVACGLSHVKEDAMIAVHDAARPLITSALVRTLWEACMVKGNAVSCAPVSDSLRLIGVEGDSQAVVRSKYRAVHTPQVFRASVLKNAYKSLLEGPVEACSRFTDDASVAEAAGEKIHLVESLEPNLKITHPSDFAIAQQILSQRGWNA